MPVYEEYSLQQDIPEAKVWPSSKIVIYFGRNSARIGERSGHHHKTLAIQLGSYHFSDAYES